MQRRAARARFEALLLGAERYLAQGGDPALLTPERAQQLGVLPQDWFGGARLLSASTPYFIPGSSSAHRSPPESQWEWRAPYDELKPIIEAYGANASRTYFPNTEPLSPASAPREPAMMAMTFDRTGLERAATVAIQRQNGRYASDAAARARNESVRPVYEWRRPAGDAASEASRRAEMIRHIDAPELRTARAALRPAGRGCVSFLPGVVAPDIRTRSAR